MAGTPAVLTICGELTPTFRSCWNLWAILPNSFSLPRKFCAERRRPPTESVPSIFPCLACETFVEAVPWTIASAIAAELAINLDFFADTSM